MKKTLELHAWHSIHFCPCVGVIGATFAVGACLSARFRDKDDYKNAVVGGMLAGLIFGYKSKCQGLIKRALVTFVQ